MSTAIGYCLVFTFGLSVMYWAVEWTAWWRTKRPMVGYDHTVRRIRALSLHGTPWRSRRHGR